MTNIKTYKFNEANINEIKKMKYGLDWPIVYIINNKKEAYIGQTTSAFKRTKDHLKNDDRNGLNEINIIYDKQFNVSAIQDIETMLIKNIGADGKFVLQNIVLNPKQHNYYQRQLYQDKFENIWKILVKNNLVENNLFKIQNSNLFKFSPYKTLTEDQRNTTQDIFHDLLEHVRNSEKATFIVNGGAGTGKTVLAAYLFKLIKDVYDNKYNMDDLSEEDIDFINELLYLRNIEEFELGFVIPMGSLRKTMKKVFSKIKGLKASMVIGPSDVLKKHYDLLIVDEAHRLKRRVNLSSYGSFDKNNETLELGNEGTELDWIMLSSKYQILFYDKSQSVKPTDVRRSDFEELTVVGNVNRYNLSSQLRVKGGNDYIDYIESLLNITLKKKKTFDTYDFKLFDDVDTMIKQIKEKDKELSLCRNVAGYAWKWKTKGLKFKDIIKEGNYDIAIDNYKYIWNTDGNDWVNSKNAIHEIGCIHTVQGYDLNYAGVIFGNEIKFDKNSQKIVIDASNYFDINGSRAIQNPDELHEYILNIYKVLMTRGIVGTYVYVCDEELRNYFKNYIESF